MSLKCWKKYLLDSILYKAPSVSENPKEYISSIDSSGYPKVDYIMNKYRASTIEYVLENPPPKLAVNDKEIKKNYNDTINNNNYKPKETHIHNSPPINNNTIPTKPRSKSCPPLKDLPCNNCKKMVPIDDLEPCERCGNGCYCSEECQYANWPIHKKKCRNLGLVIKMKRNYSF
ncbi:hypothetical protein DICPUDRAFT_152453 [Dictyostelium purpureum]|uniref:MYND-type domain-containing protein n=1 Tax=Dictyostelium purpureum TaxID=5786 RepID=F0ZLE3_DICPU|nr:uncharacterized protein DICPUDRAFT_152453 [Dictyostelium purpureum]EGC35245.1 hypothetical protein DICPUDRAFT_152453 [Dictyostelium purpureum]|eukprot:XP_003288232.1 hypothetical protein DICPUDRAFT_152453 [Dictyostelium purpureum]